MRKILNKQFRWNGVILSVQSRCLFPLFPNILQNLSILDQNQSCIKPVDSAVLINLPFKDQKSAVRKQLSDLGKKIDRVIQPVFTSRKISEDLIA